MTFNKKVLAGLVAFAAASTSAQAVTVAANDGWELGVGGLINQFLVFTDDNNGDKASEVRDGLLPAFLNFDMKAPTINGLDIAAHISFSPSTNSSSYDAFEQREVYFTVGGSFGQVLMGKALGLYGSHNILTDQTLFGVGYDLGPNNRQTTLGGIALGYDYASWRSQIKWTSPDLNGFKVAVAVMDSAGGSLRVAGGKPTGSLATGNGGQDSDDLRYEGDLSYAGSFNGGSYTGWLSAVTQGNDVRGGVDRSDDETAWTVGGTVKVGGFEFMAQYSDSEGSTEATAAVAGVDYSAAVDAVDAVPESGTIGQPGYTAYVPAVEEKGVVAGSAYVPATSGEKLEWSQYIIQGGYRFGGTTLVSANYAELEDKNAATNDTIEKFTIGVYHDVNANLKLVAEYTNVEDDNKDKVDLDIFSIGAFVFF